MVDRRKKRNLIEKANFKEELILKETLLKMFQKNGLKSSKGVTVHLSSFRVIKKMKNFKMLS
jgi:hypothetical protein